MDTERTSGVQKGEKRYQVSTNNVYYMSFDPEGNFWTGWVFQRSVSWTEIKDQLFLLQVSVCGVYVCDDFVLKFGNSAYTQPIIIGIAVQKILSYYICLNSPVATQCLTE